jgi:hypothetical protein
VLHATFFGPKHPNADVENLVLYNIDSFKAYGRNGIRFEHGGAVPSAPDGAEYRFCYRYALAPRSGGFTHWRQGRTLASFDWTDLGAFGGEKKLAQVWLAPPCQPRQKARVDTHMPARQLTADPIFPPHKAFLAAQTSTCTRRPQAAAREFQMPCFLLIQQLSCALICDDIGDSPAPLWSSFV